MQINPSKTALQNFLALLDGSNPAAPSLTDQVTLTNLTAIDPATNGGSNTSVEIDGVAGHGYSGAVTVKYGREALTDQVAAESGSVQIPNGTTDAATILSLVVAFYKIIPGEVTWVSAPSAPGSFPNDTTAQIQSSGSYVYTDGTATVNLHWN